MNFLTVLIFQRYVLIFLTVLNNLFLFPSRIRLTGCRLKICLTFYKMINDLIYAVVVLPQKIPEEYFENCDKWKGTP
jgi:hypothetical protein